MKENRNVLLGKYRNSEEMSLVSIIICTCNAALFLQKQLNTILQQTFTKLEVIIIDDASTDATQQMIMQHADADRRIRYFFNETKEGLSKNFEKAILLCTAEYIAVAEQDGIWELNKIEAMIKHWPVDCNFIYSLSKDFNCPVPKRNEGNKILNYYSGNKPQKLFFDTPIHGHASMFQRSLAADALPFPADVNYNWWLSVVASSIGKVGCVPLTLTYHRIHSANLSQALVNRKSKQEQDQQLREQRLLLLETFLAKPFIKNDVRTFLKRYKNRLKQKTDNSFSIVLFLFYLRNSYITFHYKLDMSVFSLLKHSFKRAFTGL